MVKLTVLLISFGLLALIIVYWALKKTQLNKLCALVCFSLIGLMMYGHWGAYYQLAEQQQRAHQQLITAQALKQYKGPKDVISKMEAHLKQKPNSIKGWYLLGRLYQSQQQFDQAESAFKRAYNLDSKDLKVRLQLMEVSYINNGQHINSDTQLLLNGILSAYPYQLDALNFAAADAFSHQQYQKASTYWQKMLEVLPEGSKEKQAVLKAIATAQMKEKKNVR